MAQPNITEITAWRETQDFGINIVYYGFRNCLSEVCPFLGWEGNSDVAGLGVSCSYSIYTVRY
jgi:hypothetical protein